MKLIIASLAALTVALGIGGVATAAPSAWVPGTSYYITEEDAYELLEQTYDSAYCTGIARFGKRGEFPYEEYKVFDCSVHMRSFDCYDNRYRAVKSTRPGWFKLRLIARGDCY